MNSTHFVKTNLQTDPNEFVKIFATKKQELNSLQLLHKSHS